MEYIIFNEELLRSLPCILNLSMNKMALAMHVNTSIIVRAIARGDLKLSQLIMICNQFRISPLEFFVPLGTPKKTKVVMSKRSYTEVTINFDEIVGYGNKIENITCEHVAKLINRDKTLLDRLFSGITKSREYEEPVEEVTSMVAEVGTSDRVVIAKWYFNMELWKVLPRVTNRSKTEIALDVNDVAWMYQRILKAKRVRITRLVDICNANHLNILAFFTNDVDGIVSDNVVINADEWKPIEFHPERILTIPSDEPGVYVTQNKVCEELKTYPTKIMRMKDTENSTFFSDDLCAVCNSFDITPSFFFESNQIAARNVLLKDAANQNNILQQQLEDERRRSRSLESQLRHAKALQDISK